MFYSWYIIFVSYRSIQSYIIMACKNVQALDFTYTKDWNNDKLKTKANTTTAMLNGTCNRLVEDPTDDPLVPWVGVRDITLCLRGRNIPNLLHAWWYKALVKQLLQIQNKTFEYSNEIRYYIRSCVAMVAVPGATVAIYCTVTCVHHVTYYTQCTTLCKL